MTPSRPMLNSTELLLKTKTETKIGCWNVRTMYAPGKAAQIAREMARCNVDLLGVSETRWTGCGKIRIASGETIVFSGRTEDDADHIHGVAFLMTKRVEGALMEWEPINERIIRVRLRSKFRNVTVINVYAPTNEAEMEVKEEFYTRLQGVVDRVKANDLMIIMGDVNAKVGSNNDGHERIMGKHGIGEQNENGRLFTEFCSFNEMVIGGSVFPHKRIYNFKETWNSPDGRTRNQIDHFTISRKWRRTMRNVRAYRGADVGSDHMLLKATLKLKIAKREITTKSGKKYKIERMKDRNMETRFNQELTRNLDESEFAAEDHIEGMWEKVKNAYKKAAEDTIGIRKREDKEWLSEQTWELIEERRQIKLELLNERSEERKANLNIQYRNKSREVKRSARRDKRNFEEEVMNNAEEAAGRNDMRTVYECTRKLSGQRSNINRPVRNREGNIVTDEQEQMKVWIDHFKEILNQEQNEVELMEGALPALRVKDGRITKQEIKEAIKDMKGNKSGGIDEIPAEFFKNSLSISEEVIYVLLNKVWTEERIPEDWRTGLLVKLPKKGDLSQCGNWRGITLLSTASKILAKILQRRIKGPIDGVLRKNQAGFRENRSCTDQITSLRIIIEQSIEWNCKLHMLFIDFEKAFDSANRGLLWRLLRNYGLPDKIVRMIRVLYNDFQIKIMHEGVMSEGFECRSGVKQGCSLSGTLFLIMVDYIMKRCTNERTGITWKVFEQLEDLEFADDVCLISATRQQLQRKAEKLREEAEKAGLRINKRKTKYMKVNDGRPGTVTIEGEDVEDVEDFLYLGSIIDKNGGTENDVKRRINRAIGAFGLLSKVWRSNNFSIKNKLRIFNSNVKSVLLYGCETWKMNKIINKKLQVCINKCLRRILRIRWPETVSNEELWRRANQEPIEVQIRRRKWRWVGHTLRKEQGDIAKEALEWNPAGKRRVGRPKSTWRRTLMEELGMDGRTWEEIKREAANRVRWRGTVEALCSRRSLRD